jgi:uncharacterized membrane protein
MAQKVASVIAAIFYVAAGAFHFIKTDAYVRTIPPYTPYFPLHQPLVIISDFCEILGGIGLFLPQMRRAAALGLVALLIAVFPANLYMATNPVEAGGASIPPVLLWGRLPVQILLIWWILWCTKPHALYSTEAA